MVAMRLILLAALVLGPLPTQAQTPADATTRNPAPKDAYVYIG